MGKLKKRTLISAAIVVAVIGLLVSIMIPSYCDYMPRAKWAKAIAQIAELKLVISECLLDSKGNSQSCNSVTQLNKYGLKALPVLTDNAGTVEISAIANQYPLSIFITGSEALEGCQFAFVPAVDSKEQVSWSVFFVHSTAASEEKCLTRIKGSKSLALPIDLHRLNL